MCFCSFARCKYQFSWRDGGSVHLLQPWPQRAAPDQVSLRQASTRVPQFWHYYFWKATSLNARSTMPWQFIISGGDNLFQNLISKDSWGFPIVFMLELRNSSSARRSVRARPWVPQKYIPSAFWRREGDTVVKMHSALWLAAARHYWERSIWSLPRYHVLSCCILHLDTL